MPCFFGIISSFCKRFKSPTFSYQKLRVLDGILFDEFVDVITGRLSLNLLKKSLIYKLNIIENVSFNKINKKVNICYSST